LHIAGHFVAIVDELFSEGGDVAEDVGIDHADQAEQLQQ
jgi:hypothetical protein